MPGIAIDWTLLEAAFESHAPDVKSFLNRRTGEVATVADAAAEPERARYRTADWQEIEPVPSREQYRMMERFIETVTHQPLKDRLQDSIVGKGAFRRFKDVVGRFPEERKRWFAFRDVLLHRYILDWLKLQRVEIVEMPAWSLDLPTTPAADAGTEITSTEGPPLDDKQEAEELRGYVLAWARAHGEEYHYLFGPAAFERLAFDIAQEFTVLRRRNG